MKTRQRKDKLKYKNKIRKQQANKMLQEEVVTEDDCGVNDEIMSRMKGKMLEMSGGVEHELIRDSSQEKMSDILLTYAKPFIDTINTDNKEDYERAIQISMIFWNCAIMYEAAKSRKDRKEIIKMLKPVMLDAESKSVVNYMLVRKQQLYPGNKRMIMNYELSVTAEGLHLSVVSTFADTAAETSDKSRMSI